MLDSLADVYGRFAEREARGRSELYAELALGVAGDPELLALLAELPRAKRQPNLLFSAVKLLHGVPADFAALRACVLENRDEVLATVRARRTQTNEPSAQAPAGATLVVFHTAVLAYVADPAERRAFAETVRALGATWVANEAPDVLTEPGGEPWPRGRFLLTCDGQPVAWTDPHGTAIDWLA